MATERVFLIDGTALAYRSHFAFIRAPLFDPRGRNTSAVYGFTATLMKLLREEKPDRIAVAFDTPEPTFRHERYEKYKATREKMPDEMVDQLPLIRTVVEAFGIPFVEKPGFEADDVIGTLARQAAEAGHEVFLVTGDKDFMQLVDERVRVYDIMKPGQEEARILDPEGVVEVWGVKPTQIVDLLGLMGDTSDNVPGVPGIGKKTALKLLTDHGTLEATLEAAPGLKAKKQSENLVEFADQARLSRELVVIDTHVPLEVRLDDLVPGERDDATLTSLFSELAFHRFQEELGLGGAGGERLYHTVRTEQELETLLATLRDAETIVLDTETTDLDPMRADLVGLSFAVAPHEAWYVPCNAEPPGRGGRRGDAHEPDPRPAEARARGPFGEAGRSEHQVRPRRDAPGRSRGDGAGVRHDARVVHAGSGHTCPRPRRAGAPGTSTCARSRRRTSSGRGATRSRWPTFPWSRSPSTRARTPT
jgi:DNA polymerase-1